jgi:hypothetical protein
VERGSARLSRSTRRDITWPNRRSDLRLGKHPLYHLGGTACVLALLLGRDVASDIAGGLTGRQPVTQTLTIALGNVTRKVCRPLVTLILPIFKQ